MVQKRDEWQFLRLRAAQLYEEDNAKGALRLLKILNQQQERLFAQVNQAENVNKQRIVSTHQ